MRDWSGLVRERRGEIGGRRYCVGDHTEDAAEEWDWEAQGDAFDCARCALGELLRFAGGLAIVGVDVDEFAHGFCFHEADFESAGLEVFGVAGEGVGSVSVLREAGQ